MGWQRPGLLLGFKGSAAQWDVSSHDVFLVDIVYQLKGFFFDLLSAKNYQKWRGSQARRYTPTIQALGWLRKGLRIPRQA